MLFSKNKELYTLSMWRSFIFYCKNVCHSCGYHIHYCSCLSEDDLSYDEELETVEGGENDE